MKALMLNQKKKKKKKIESEIFFLLKNYIITISIISYIPL